MHSSREQIYRLNEVQNFTGTNVQKVALSMPGMGPTLLQEFPEVVNFARFMCRPKQMLSRDDQKFLLPYVAIVDSTFLEIFDFEMLIGDRGTALDDPQSMVVTEKTALLFFPDIEQAMGNSIRFRDKEFKVTGVLRNVPEHSHMQFDALASMTTITRENPGFNDQWGSNFLNTYLV